MARRKIEVPKVEKHPDVIAWETYANDEKGRIASGRDEIRRIKGKEMIRELSASHITRIAIARLTLDHVTCWRQPNNVAKRRKGTAKKGVPDILGYDNSSGKMVGCEVKKIGDVLSDDQKEFLEDLDLCGGKALIAHQLGNHVVLTPYVEYVKKASMTLEERIQLVNDLTEKDAGVTIDLYTRVEKYITSLLKAKNMRYTVIRQEHKDIILELAKEMGAAEIRKGTKLSLATIYRVLKESGFDIKTERRRRRTEEKEKKAREKEAERLAAIEARKPSKPILEDAPAKTTPFTRPPAVYSNHSPFWNSIIKNSIMKKERPILFSTPMVQALLAGRKTQTRRILKLKHMDPANVGAIHPDGSGKRWVAWAPRTRVTAEMTALEYPGERGFGCPIGAIGGLIWVREEHYAYGWWEKNGLTKTGKQKWKFVRSDDPAFGIYFYDTKPQELRLRQNNYRGHGWYKRLGRFMPRKYCRIWLEITDIRAERVRDISEADAKAEGIEDLTEGHGLSFRDYRGGQHPLSPRASFLSLWESINGKESLDANPWVWAISFKILSTTGKPETL